MTDLEKLKLALERTCKYYEGEGIEALKELKSWLEYITEVEYPNKD